MRVAMIGAGYVGLVSGACFSEFGLEVLCVDKDDSKIATLEAGEIPIFEPDWKIWLKKMSRQDVYRLQPTLKAVKFADAIFIAVGTLADEETVMPTYHMFTEPRVK